MGKYDSILKEKKKTTITIEEEPKKFPKFLVSCFFILLVLIISYIIYFNNVLTPKNIIIQDSLNTLSKINSLINNFPLLELNNEKNITGNINYNNENFKFNIIKNQHNLNFNISSNNQYINYYLLNDKTYIKIPSITEYISLKSNSLLNIILSLEEKLLTINETKYIKSFYIDNKKPIVEINFTLNTIELNEIFKLNLEEEIDLIATFKNNAIKNNIEEIKIIINNKTKQERQVIEIKNNKLSYKKNNDIYLLDLEEHENNFNIKITKNDVLYSVLTVATTDNNYIYTYQAIDDIYNLNLKATKNNDIYSYEITKKKQELEEKVTIDLKIEEGYIIENNLTNIVEKNNLNIESYNNNINYFKDKFLRFIN